MEHEKYIFGLIGVTYFKRKEKISITHGYHTVVDSRCGNSALQNESVLWKNKIKKTF